MTDTGLFGNANEIDIVLIAFPKIGKSTHGRLELLTSIFCPMLNNHFYTQINSKISNLVKDDWLLVYLL